MTAKCVLLGWAISLLAIGGATDSKAQEQGTYRWQSDGQEKGGYRNLYAVEPYWAYPPEFFVLRRHPSQYYYTFPDRYYSRRFYYPQEQMEDYDRSQPYRPDVYGYWEPDYRQYDRPREYRDYQDRRPYDLYDYRYEGW